MRIPRLGRLKALLANYEHRPVEKKFFCPVCETKVSDFEPLSESYLKNLQDNLHIHPFFAYETLNVFHYNCPNCKAGDRDRLHAIFLRDKFATLDKSKPFKLIDIAPNKALTN